MDPHDSTIANADLWTKYLTDEWSRWLNPLGSPASSPVSQVAEGTAARVASFLTLVAAGPIAWMYAANASNITPIRREKPAFLRDGDLESVEEPAA